MIWVSNNVSVSAGNSPGLIHVIIYGICEILCEILCEMV